MTLSEFLSHLQSKQINLWAEGDKLCYNAPLGVLTDDLAVQLAERKAEILRVLRVTGVASSPILRTLRDQNLPLSFAQQRLWFLDQLEPDSSLYNISKAIRLNGGLNVEALQKTLDTIVARHEILRTNIVAVDGSPVQVITDSQSVKLAIIDLSDRSNGEQRQAEMQCLLDSEAQRPFNLSSDLMLRATLLCLGENDHVLLLVIHHIASDGWSMSILLQELAAVYNAFLKGNACPLPELPIQYADFAVWQRRWLQGSVLEDQLSYWKKQLEGLPTLQLPTDRPRPALQTFRGARQSLVLTKSLADALKRLSRQEGVTLFMILLAVFKTLLYRYTGQEDIVVGSPIANRTQAEIEGLIGFFVNTLVLRTDLSGNPSFRELLARVRKVAMGAYDHQDLPFEKLVEELHPERNLSRTPLFQVMFVLQNAPRSGIGLADLVVSSLEVNTGTAKFDLTLSMVEATDLLRASLEYNTDLFEEATISRMLGHFQNLLEGIVANPDRRLSDLPVLTEAEKQQLVVEWNDTKRDYPEDKCIHELFEAQMDRSPDAVAVVFEDKQLTYRELNRRANQLGHYLQKLGVGPEVRVGVYMRRSLDMVVGLLAILKAGGVYVPLDVEYPKERLTFMLDDSRASVLLTQRPLKDKLPEYRGDILCLDADSELFSHEPEYNPVSRATAENLAYVVYTSGSTGRPKGVTVAHRPVNRLLVNTNYVNLQSTDVVAQVSNCSFDAATLEIWGALLHGARLVGITTDVVLSPKDFAAQVEEKRISVLFLTTALFNQMARELPAAFKNVRHLLFGGEAVDPKWVAEVLQHGPPRRLLHVYGPTETTTFASWHLVENIREGAATIPIGRPIANTEMYVLDLLLQPVPIGVLGELYIGGDGLARGYLNRRELTAEKFIPSPFSDEPGARLYKTGDLARYLPDGNIEFLGRTDDQVKIRGFRIELGEIEAVLGQHPAVQQAVVLAREDVRVEKQLVAYVIPNRESPLTINDVRDFLRQKLPDYMVPSAFVLLDALPLTPNGKVDRRALPTPDQTRPELENPFLAPRTPVEEALAGIWAEVLKLEKVGIHDNFFDLGGHSLLATQVISRVRDTFQVELPLRALFEKPTVADLAVQIAQAQAKKAVPEEMKDILADVESLSDEEAERLLAQESSKRI